MPFKPLKGDTYTNVFWGFARNFQFIEAKLNDVVSMKDDKAVKYNSCLSVPLEIDVPNSGYLVDITYRTNNGEYIAEYQMTDLNCSDFNHYKLIKIKQK